VEKSNYDKNPTIQNTAETFPVN